MTIAAEMEDALFALARAAARTTDAALRELLVAAQQRFEELRLDVLQLEGLHGTVPRPTPAAVVPASWTPQREAQASELAGGVVDLGTFRAARASGAVRL